MLLRVNPISIETLGIISSFVNVVTSFNFFLNVFIFSIGIDIPAAIGCPPNLPNNSLHLSNSSNILYSSIDLPEPFATSCALVKIIVGKLYLSLILPAIIPAILSWTSSK